MIKIIDGEFDQLDDFESFCKRDSFGTRIYSLYLCYGYDFNFVDFWVQLDDTNRVVTVVSRLDGDFVLSVSEYSDFCELSEFLDFQNKYSVSLSEKYSGLISLNAKETVCGDILRFSGFVKNTPKYEIITPDLHDYYDILKMCESKDFSVPEYEYFLSDTVRRLNRGMCTVYGTKSEDTLTSCAMSVSNTDFSVILGAVATNPNFRRMGYAGTVVSSLAKYYYDKTGIVYIYTTIEKNTRFYESLNFNICDRWIKFIFRKLQVQVGHPHE